MQQQQILNQDEKIDRLLFKIATLEQENQMLKIKMNHTIIILLLCVIIGCVMMIIQNTFYNSG